MLELSKPSTLLRSSLLALAALGLHAGAYAQSLLVGGPQQAILKGDAHTGGFQAIAGCGGPITCMTAQAGLVFVGTEHGDVYVLTEGTGQITYIYTVAGGVSALAKNASHVFAGRPDGAVLEVHPVTGEVSQTWSNVLFGSPIDALALEGNALAAGSVSTAFGELDIQNGGFQLLGACGGSVTAMARRGSELYLGDPLGRVYRYDPANFGTQFLFTLPTDIRAMAFDGAHLLLGGDAGFVLRVNPENGAIVGNFPAGIQIRALVVGEPPVEVGTAYCMGLGCPCGNDDAQGGCANTTGHGASLHGSGSSSVTADALVLSAEDLPPNVLSRLYMSQGANLLPFGDGLLCAGGGYPAFRFTARSSGPGGVLAEGPGLAQFSGSNFGAGGEILAGSTWNFQAWYRNPNGPCGSNFNLSSGYRVTFAP